MNIAKEFHWEMAHRLPFHTAGCQNIHGHSYRMNVEIDGVPDAHGMVLDYLALKEIIQPMVAELDHAFLCDETDAPVKIFLEKNSMKHVVVNFSTTAENIAAMFAEKIGEALMPYKNIFSLTVRVAETANTYAEISRELRASRSNISHKHS